MGLIIKGTIPRVPSFSKKKYLSVLLVHRRGAVSTSNAGPQDERKITFHLANKSRDYSVLGENVKIIFWSTERNA